MTHIQENKNSMFYAVIRKCLKFESVWRSIPAFEAAFDEFNFLFKAIQAANENQLRSITGITDAKQKEEDEMIARTLEVASSVYAFARLAENHELKRMVDFSPSTLKNMSDTELRSMCSMVSRTATSVLVELKDYGTTVADINILEKEIEDYGNIIMEPRKALSTRAKATAHMVDLFPKADRILKERMDKILMLFKAKQPDFYAEYFNARRINYLGMRHLSLEPEA